LVFKPSVSVSLKATCVCEAGSNVKSVFAREPVSLEEVCVLHDEKAYSKKEYKQQAKKCLSKAVF
jgi:hypothetical protein